MKQLLIIFISILLSSHVIGQSSKYESVSQCVLQTMKENKLNGNDMFKMVKKECESILGSVDKPKFEQNNGNKNEILYSRLVDGNWGWYKSGDDKIDDKYFGEVESEVPNGLGTETFPDGRKYVGDWKSGVKNGHGTEISHDGRKYVGKYKDGKRDGQGSYYYPSGEKYAGEWKNGKPWNITGYDKNGNIIGKIVNGQQQ